MPRAVAVDLTLDAAEYLAEARAVKSETSAVDREMDQLDRSIDKVDRDMAELAVTSKVAARQVDDLGDQARGSAAALTALDARIKATRVSVRELGLEFAATGDKADGAGYNREKSLLARLEKLQKDLTPEVPSVDTGSSMSLGRGALIGSAIGLVVALSPAIGAAIEGAVVGTVAGGGIVGGIIAAAHDSRVQSAWKDFMLVISPTAFGADTFVEPTVEGIGIIKNAFLDLHIGDVLAKGSTSVTEFASGIANFARNIMPGFDDVMGHSESLTRVFSAGISDTGSAISDFLTDMVNSKGTLEGLDGLFRVINGTIRDLGTSLAWLGDRYDEYIHWAAARTGQLEDIFGWVPWVGDQFRRWNDQFEEMSTVGPVTTNVLEAVHAVMVTIPPSAEDAAKAMLALYDSVHKVNNAFLELEGDEVAAEAAIDDLADSLEENGLTFDKNTAAGRQNVSALIAVANTAEATVRQMLSQNRSLADVGAAYDHYRQELYDTAIQAGATADEAQNLVDKWLSLQALDDLTKLVTIHIDYVRTGGSQTTAYENGVDNIFTKGFAAGGTTPGGFEPFVVGEHGPELMAASRSAFVATAQQWNGAVTGGSSNRTITIIVKDTSGRTMRQEAISEAQGRNVPNSLIQAAYP